ncbi:MAG TPA: amidohydrolase family protein [Solirubrobacteraceae bacterium]|nr:amidohydrolase family protein [Solirubrobacteraceae bacterium]
MPPVINVHTHYQPASVLPIIEPYGISMTTGPDGGWHFRSGDVEYNIPTTPDKFWGSGLGGQIPEMDAAGVDINVLQPSPMIFSYHLEAPVNREFSRAFNDETAAHIAEHPDRFWGSAQLPMQDLVMAAEELERAVAQLGLKACSLGYVLGPDRTLADPECDEFLSAVEQLDVPILLHPVALGQDMDLRAGGGEWLLKYQLDWAWGYLFSETAAVIGFIFSGALDRHPDLRIMVPHGGGMIPYQFGRMEHQARVFGAGHRDAGERLKRPPAEYLKRFWFDTVVHDPRALTLLIDVMGEDNVVLGSNYPGWDNAPIWETIRALPQVSDRAKAKILGENAAERLFRVSVPTSAAGPSR